jgi:hypothetical protein
MMAINVENERMEALAQGFGCQIGTLPFPYLGLAVGTTRPSIQDLTPVVHRLERRLMATSSFLSQGARLQLITSAISSMPIHMLCTMHIPPGITKQFDRIIRQCLWMDNVDTPKQSLASWKMICKPKAKGGLGIIDFQKKNDALLMKFLHKFYNKKMDVPWVKLIWETYYEGEVPHAAKACGSYWWKDLIKLMDQYRGFAKPEVKSGETVLFWSDAWELDSSTVPLRDRFPRLFSFAKDSKISVRDMVQLQHRAEEFYLPFSAKAYDEFILLQGWLDNISLHQLGSDTWSCAKGDYRANAYYVSLYDHVVVDPQFQWIWKSKCIMKIKMFSWHMLSDHLNTKDLLQRRHWNVTNDYSCVLCPGHHHEDRDHLFFNCIFSSRVWAYLQIQWGTSGNMVQTTE